MNPFDQDLWEARSGSASCGPSDSQLSSCSPGDLAMEVEVLHDCARFQNIELFCRTVAQEFGLQRELCESLVSTLPRMSASDDLPLDGSLSQSGESKDEKTDTIGRKRPA